MAEKQLMDRSHRLLAEKIYDKFEDAFPQVKRAEIALKNNGKIFQRYASDRDFPGLVPCENKLCKRGGFELDIILAAAVGKKATKETGFLMCHGYETMGNRWKRKPCWSFASYELTVEYK